MYQQHQYLNLTDTVKNILKLKLKHKALYGNHLPKHV